MVALFSRQSDPPSYFCGGVLVANNKILTAAHCVWDKQQPKQMLARDVIVKVGVYDLADLYELYTTSIAASEIIIHTNWNPFTERFNDDLAMIMLEDEVHTSIYVRPICVADIHAVRYATEGVAVGWGRSEDKTKSFENIPRYIKLPIPSNDDCYRDHHLLARIAGKFSFCAGRNQSGVCTGFVINSILPLRN